MRIGHGYDVHRLKAGRDLYIGGVKIDYEFGLDGHSDADVLLHAICDALLGAAALGDIGVHFPDSDDRFKDIDSKILLAECVRLIGEKGYAVENIDCTVVAQRPRLSKYVLLMRQTIAEKCGVDIDCVNVKATTEEGLGFTGRLEGITTPNGQGTETSEAVLPLDVGISAHAVCLLKQKDFSNSQ